MWTLHSLQKLLPKPSTVIRSFNYQATSRQLGIEFQSGLRYIYYDVPEEVFRALRAAESRGAYFNASVRDRYSYSRVDSGPAVTY
jgi:hypothetical protein